MNDCICLQQCHLSKSTILQHNNNKTSAVKTESYPTQHECLVVKQYCKNAIEEFTKKTKSVIIGQLHLNSIVLYMTPYIVISFYLIYLISWSSDSNKRLRTPELGYPLCGVMWG